MRLLVRPAIMAAATALVTVSVPAAAAAAGHSTASGRPHSAAAADGWKTMVLPGSVVQPAVLDDIAAASPDEVWAVGSQNLSHGSQPLLLRWNGRRWVQDVIPVAAGQVDLVSTVARASGRPAAAWALGYYASEQNLILRWTGHRWVRVLAPPILRTQIAYSVAAGTSRDAWLFGYADSKGNLLEHWRAGHWHQIRVPYKLWGDATEMIATGPQDVWLSDEVGSGADVIARYDAGKWSSVKPQQGVRFITGFLPVTLRNVWVSGWQCTEVVIGEGCNASRAEISHWNGSAWTAVKHLGQLTGTTSITPGRTGQPLWAGASSATGTSEPLLYEHFNARTNTWSLVPGSSPLRGIGSTTTAVAAVPGTNATWAFTEQIVTRSQEAITTIQYHAGG